MSIDAYKVFISVVEEKSFVKAANIMHMTPSGVSHCINKLEEQYQFKLFARERTGAQLTADGKRLLPYIRDILRAEDRFQQEVDGTKGLEFGSVCLGTFNSVCIKFIPEIISSLHQVHPKIEINVCQGGYGDTVEWLKTGLADVSFVSMSTTGDSKAEPLFEDRIMCVTPKSFKPQNGSYVEIQELSAINLVYQRNGCDADSNALLSQHGISTSSRFSVESDQALIALVASGLGVSLMPELLLNPAPDDVSIYPLAPVFHRTIGLAVAAERPLSLAAQSVYKHIVELYKTL